MATKLHIKHMHDVNFLENNINGPFAIVCTFFCLIFTLLKADILIVESGRKTVLLNFLWCENGKNKYLHMIINGMVLV